MFGLTPRGIGWGEADDDLDVLDCFSSPLRQVLLDLSLLKSKLGGACGAGDEQAKTTRIQSGDDDMVTQGNRKGLMQRAFDSQQALRMAHDTAQDGVPGTKAVRQTCGSGLRIGCIHHWSFQA